jgi:hypothetical protein
MKIGDLVRLYDSPHPVGLILTKETDPRFPGENLYRILWNGKVPDDYHGKPTSRFPEELIKPL